MKSTNVRMIRKDLKLTQTQFADKIGVAFCTVNRWEKGRSRPSKLALKEISKLINKDKTKED
jgi:DNA-binding transcriptional regulator YiaG